MSDEDVLRRLDALEAAIKELREGLAKRKGLKVSRPASYQEVEDYVVGELKLTKTDAMSLWEHWEGNGFKNGRAPMASWKATASNWERRKIFFPSLQQNERYKLGPPGRR